MNGNQARVAWIYIGAVTVLSVGIIAYNFLTGLRIPFRVEFLIGYIFAAMVFVIWHGVLTKGWRRTAIMVTLSFLVAFTAEALGVNFGLIFGAYHYTGVLGLSVAGVPLLAALAWEPILYAGYCMSDVLTPLTIRKSVGWLGRLPGYIWLAGISAFATTAWDLMIDPIAISQGWWVWENGGSYMPYLANGVPITNFLGWLGVAFLINFIFRLINDDLDLARSPEISVYGPLTLYASLFMTSFGVTVTVLCRPEVGLVGLMAMGPFIGMALTNINLVQRGLAAFLNTNWLGSENPTAQQAQVTQP